jgi:uncharacterized protein
MTVVMIKPTNSCNLACTYCYNTDVFLTSPSDLMTYETLKNALTKITSYENKFGRPVTYEWIGGEPLLAGLNFYKQVVNITNELLDKGYYLP